MKSSIVVVDKLHDSVVARFDDAEVSFDDDVFIVSCKDGKYTYPMRSFEFVTSEITTLIDIDKLKSSNEELHSSRHKIETICDGMKDLLLYKNEKYGDSALNPKNVFYKGDATNSIKIRLDDKIGRVMNCNETRINDVCDIIGYCVLLLASMNICKEDIEKFKD